MEQTRKRPSGPREGGGHAIPFTAYEVRQQLERIISSSLFSQSKRSSRFLSFVVDRSLAGCADELKERTLAIEVFDREPTYDSSSDPIVRVAAGDLRKRLAQYYVQQAHTDELRILLPAGHYRPLFERPSVSYELPTEILVNEAPGQPVSPVEGSLPIPRPKSEREPLEGRTRTVAPLRSFFICACVVLALSALSAVTLALYRHLHQAERDLWSFWAPAKSGSPVLLCIGNFDTALLVDLNPTERQTFERIVGPRSMVGPGNLSALTTVSLLLGQMGSPATVSMADGVSLSDLRNAPAILIGVYDNPWTGRVLNGERFQFQKSATDTGENFLLDTMHPARKDWRVSRATPLPALQRDYALITRTRSPLTGQTDFVIAGISPYGTIAAGEFVTRPEYFRQFAEVAPRDWRKRDLQIVVSTDLVNSRSAPPRLLAFEVH